LKLDLSVQDGDEDKSNDKLTFSNIPVKRQQILSVARIVKGNAMHVRQHNGLQSSAVNIE